MCACACSLLSNVRGPLAHACTRAHACDPPELAFPPSSCLLPTVPESSCPCRFGTAALAFRVWHSTRDSAWLPSPEAEAGDCRCGGCIQVSSAFNTRSNFMVEIWVQSQNTGSHELHPSFPIGRRDENFNAEHASRSTSSVHVPAAQLVLALLPGDWSANAALHEPRRHMYKMAAH